MKVIRAKIPDQLYRQMTSLIKEGWFPNQLELVEKALRKFLNSFHPELIEKFIREDVEWGLRGGK
jgi:Arc/MetJ-type ribon-helix-helix transcriptional regulator